MLGHISVGRHKFQLLGHVLADHHPVTATTRAGQLLGRERMFDSLDGQTLRKLEPFASSFTFPTSISLYGFRRGLLFFFVFLRRLGREQQLLIR